ncbi:hypothetical protein CV093_18840 [Oceanobacillus sp. 143]|nr:hypothetical protein CV093_18840 [Oceanobacillus sp. 143]
MFECKQTEKLSINNIQALVQLPGIKELLFMSNHSDRTVVDKKSRREYKQEKKKTR